MYYMTFSQKVLKKARQIPKGKVTSYKAIAKKAGTSERAVGSILKSNKKLVIVPCHRVIKSNGEIGGYSQGIRKKIFLLKKEGVKIKGKKVISELFPTGKI